MQVVFESRDQEAAQFRELVERRVQFVMRRLTWLVPRARVQLCDINGPRGGVDKRCQVELKTDFAGTVVVTAIDRDWRCAIENALTRAARGLVRTLQRGRSLERPRTRALRFQR